jgi:hypothetical protein
MGDLSLSQGSGSSGSTDRAFEFGECSWKYRKRVRRDQRNVDS